MLEIIDISTYYGDVRALDGLTIKVNKGEIVSLLGSNGAGKTTALMTISGVLKARSGRVLFMNEDITNIKPHLIIEKGLSHCPEGRRIFPRMTVAENLELGAFRRGLKKENLEMSYWLFPVLKERAKQKAGTLSGGEQQMLALARALMCNPELLMLDEPSLGIAPMLTEKIFDSLRTINEKGITILLVEQNAYAALRLSHRAYVIENGSVKLQGLSSDLLLNEGVKNVYLGGHRT